MTTVQLKIPVGYTVTQRHEVVDIDTAVSLLKSRKRRKYISAYRTGFESCVKLRKDIWKCPYCYQEQAATVIAMQANNSRIGRDGSFEVSRTLIDKWGTNQYSLFNKDDEELALNPTPKLADEQRCPKCNRMSKPSGNLRTVDMLYGDLCLTLKTTVWDIGELLTIPWKRSSFSLRFPIYETAIFNLQDRRAYLELGDEKGETLAKLDITAQHSAWKKCTIYQLLRDNIAVKRAAWRYFSEKMGNQMPFSKKEFSPEKFILLTQFAGFPRSFYDAIPYVRGSYQIEETFHDVAGRLHKAENAILIFCESNLPKCKSLKRVLFSNMGLFFYMNECEELWRATNDINLYCRLLQNEAVFDLLSLLHQCPRLFEFVFDFACIKGAKALVEMLSHGWTSSIYPYAINYCMMNASTKRIEQEKWKKQKIRYRVHGENNDANDAEYYFDCSTIYNIRFSVPMKKPIHAIEDCVIDGFSFTWLRTGNDYSYAGALLKNCLENWGATNNPVVAVSQEEKIVAAIEVSPHGIQQVQGHRNTSISHVPGLPEAYEKWRERFGLVDAFDYMEDD